MKTKTLHPHLVSVSHGLWRIYLLSLCPWRTCLLSLPLLPLLPLPDDFPPPGGCAGSAGRCEPEAVAPPELAPDPASLGGELRSVDGAAPADPRALFSFCRCFLRSAFS